MMKKIFLLSVSALFLVTNAFALDLSTFTGTWKLSSENGADEINISLQDSVLRITGIWKPSDENKIPEELVILSKGETTLLLFLPVTFTSGILGDDKTLIINTTFNFSKVNSDFGFTSPDQTVVFSLKILEESKQLRLQTAVIDYSTDSGLIPSVKNHLYERQE